MLLTILFIDDKDAIIASRYRGTRNDFPEIENGQEARSRMQRADETQMSNLSCRMKNALPSENGKQTASIMFQRRGKRPGNRLR